MTMDRSIDISPASRVEGQLEVPGDKSISHRALLVGMIAEGPMAITGLSPAQDVASSRHAITQLGAEVQGADRAAMTHLQPESEGLQGSTLPREFQIKVAGPGWSRLSGPPEPIDVGNSGTTIRLLTGILASSSTRGTLTGDASIRRRPMDRVVGPLRSMGARIEGAGGGSLAPLTIVGAQLHGMTHRLEIASAQVKSALLLAGLRATGQTSIVEPGPSRDHTERLLSHLGVPIEKDGNRLSVKSTNIHGGSVIVPGDISSAAFFLVAAAILPGSAVTIAGVGLNPTRTGILDILKAYGAEVEVTDVVERSGEPVGSVSVRAADRRPLQVSGELTVRAIDELPLVGVLGACAEGETTVADAAELRVKESDRIATLVESLSAMGASIAATPDGFTVRGGRTLHAAMVRSAGDHRIAMTLAIAALVAEGDPTRIEGWDAVGVSYPGFEGDLARVTVP